MTEKIRIILTVCNRKIMKLPHCVSENTLERCGVVFFVILKKTKKKIMLGYNPKIKYWPSLGRREAIRT